MKNPFLIGDSIYLRPLNQEDAPLLQTWINDPEVRSTLMLHRPMNLQAEQSFIERLSQLEGHIVLMIVHRETDTPIGTCGLHDIDSKNRSAMFGISIGVKEFWGKGLGTEATNLIAQYAFETLNLHRLCLHVYEFNDRGMRSYARVGFRPEGILRESHFAKGRYWNTVIMGLLRTEWQGNTPTDQSTS